MRAGIGKLLLGVRAHRGGKTGAHRCWEVCREPSGEESGGEAEFKQQSPSTDRRKRVERTFVVERKARARLVGEDPGPWPRRSLEMGCSPQGLCSPAALMSGMWLCNNVLVTEKLS